MSPGPGTRVRAAVLPPVPALLPEHASLVDPVADLRDACRGALADLLAGAGTVVVVADPVDAADRARGATDPVGARVARALLADAGWSGPTACDPTEARIAAADARLLVMANGSARRGEKAPGHLDERSFVFDDAVAAALASGEPAALAGLDAELGDELLATGIRGLRRLGGLVGSPGAGGPPGAQIRWSGDPYGVQYWVAVLGLGARDAD